MHTGLRKVAGAVDEQHSRAALTPSEWAAMRDIVMEHRDAATARVVALEREFDGIVESAAGEATDDEHDPEGATIAFERAQLSTLLTQARRQLVDLDQALERLRAGTYGTCEGCRGPIAVERLQARPATTTCIACAPKDAAATRQ